MPNILTDFVILLRSESHGGFVKIETIGEFLGLELINIVVMCSCIAEYVGIGTVDYPIWLSMTSTTLTRLGSGSFLWCH